MNPLHGCIMVLIIKVGCKIVKLFDKRSPLIITVKTDGPQSCEWLFFSPLGKKTSVQKTWMTIRMGTYNNNLR